MNPILLEIIHGSTEFYLKRRTYVCVSHGDNILLTRQNRRNYIDDYSSEVVVNDGDAECVANKIESMMWPAFIYDGCKYRFEDLFEDESPNQLLIDIFEKNEIQVCFRINQKSYAYMPKSKKIYKYYTAGGFKVIANECIYRFIIRKTRPSMLYRYDERYMATKLSHADLFLNVLTKAAR